MSQLLHFGEIVAMNAYLSPNKLGARDLTRSLTFHKWNDRSCKLANALVGLGLRKGDRLAVLAYNCLEWMEIYAAISKAGLVVVPINFRLIGSEVQYIVENSEAKALIVQHDLLDRVETIRAERLIAEDKYIHFAGRTPPGYRSYEDLVAASARSEPSIETGPDDPFALLYTSGTTGKPKGVIRTSGSLVLLAYLLQSDWGFSRNDLGLLVMPMCHANSLYFAYVFAACGAGSCVYDRKSFEPEHLLRTLASGKFTFTSLVPTHYIMMLGLPESVRRELNVERVTRLLISSAPARHDTKLALMEYFRRSQLYEAYGSTEAGWVTLLRPEEQLNKLGSIGRERAASQSCRRTSFASPTRLIIGDGGLGISGFDLETARRYGLPIVTVLWNNSSWGPSFEEMPFLKGRTDPFEILPNQRYDRMFELMDCHGEHVERPEKFRPSLERALRAGKTALVNVVGDRTIGHPSLGGNLLGSTRV
jgi:fatty-acyl-CoA synthase